MTDLREVIIIGGGLAGLSAAIYLGRGKRDTLVIHSGRSMAKWEPEEKNFTGPFIWNPMTEQSTVLPAETSVAHPLVHSGHLGTMPAGFIHILPISTYVVVEVGLIHSVVMTGCRSISPARRILKGDEDGDPMGLM